MCASMLDTDTKISDWYNLPTKAKPRKKQPKTQFPSPNPMGKLIGHTIAFTGKLSVTRAKAAQMAAGQGCFISKSLQWHTNYLVVGNQKKGAVGLSSKQIQAETFNKDGHKISILTEQDFQILIDNS